MTKRFYCYHGSPGSIKDFSLINREFGDAVFIDMMKKNAAVSEKGVMLAYSWGCVKALNHAVKNYGKLTKIVLIAPYFFPKRKVVSEFLLNLPVVGDFLLNRLGEKSIIKFMDNSCDPVTPPGAYRVLAGELSRPEVIRGAMAEKMEIKPVDWDRLEMVLDNGVPITIIRGTGDRTSSYEEQIAPFLKIVDGVRVIEMENAGHALCWTHPKSLAYYISGEHGDPFDQFEIGRHEGIKRENNIYGFIYKYLRECPDREILKWVEKEDLENRDRDAETPLRHNSVTVKGLYEYVEAVAAGYARLGLGKGDRAILFLPMSFHLYASMFALQKIGAVPVFLDSWARRDQLKQAAASVAPRAMISVEPVFDIFKKSLAFRFLPYKIVSGPHKSKYSASIEELSRTRERVETCAVEQGDTAIITFTTGSSGAPKGADRTHGFLAEQHYALNRVIPYNDNDIDLPVFPIFSLNNIAGGVPTVIPAFDVGAPGEDDADILLAQIRACNVTCLTLNACLLNSSSKQCMEKGIQLENIRRIVTGGAPISRDDLLDITGVAPKAEVWVLYGSTEVEPISHIEARDIIRHRSVSQGDRELVDQGVNVGKIDEGLMYRFIRISRDPVFITEKGDWDDLIMENGEVGELIVAGKHVCDGYYNNPQAFNAAKIRDENGVIWHRTGDLARMDEAGNIWLVGRVHNAIRRDNTYIFPVQAEIIMKKLDFVMRCAYLGMPDEMLGEKVYAVMEPVDHPWLDDESKIRKMSAEIRRLFAKNRVIFDKIVFIKDIPMDSRHNSKVEYHVLRDRIIRGEGVYEK